MSNNLRQIAKDLRSFVKRCKDIHYSDSLLITFLVTGLLTFTPRFLNADVATEQQEVSAQTYDAISDLRQTFIRARQENEKMLKGAERELVMLMEQGDQVIKSPWASFQFSTGFQNSDWGTTFKGRGGKNLQYFRRNNDLTKYVFDASKNMYGATNLHMQRNKEPDSLTINPANIHEPYSPYIPERIDNINTPSPVSFNHVIYNGQIINLPANYVQNGTTVGYNLNAAAPTLNDSTWGSSATFDRVNDRIRTYDGWNSGTKNTWQSPYNNHLQGASSTNKGILYNGQHTGGSEYWGNYNTYPGGSTYYSWLPTSNWSAGVYYSNLTQPAPNNTKPGGSYTNNTYFTPGSFAAAGYVSVSDSNVNTGYDGVTSDVTVPWMTQWQARDSVQTNEVVGNAIIDYYVANPNTNINASGTNANAYNTFYSTTAAGARANADNARAVALAGGGSFSDVDWWNTYNNYMQTNLTAAFYTYTVGQTGAGTNQDTYTRRRINSVAGNLTTNAWTWYNAARNTNAGNNAYSRRDVLLYTNKTMDVKFLDAHISQNSTNVNGFNGGAFAKAIAGAKLSIDDVDVSLYNGGAAAYIINTNTTTSSGVELDFQSNSNSIANFNTTNSNIDTGQTANTNNNIAFNFQEGVSPETGGGLQGTTEIKGQYDVRFRGNNNTVYNMIAAADVLKISNDDGSFTDSLQVWNTQNSGRIFMRGDNNIVYHGYGAAVGATSELTLHDVQMQGDNSIMVALTPQRGQTSIARGTGGIFNGDIKLQGAFGGDAQTNNRAIAVYAASGQYAGLNPGAVMAGKGSANGLKDVDVKVLNVGFNSNVTNGISVFAINGTGVKVGSENTNNITDGLQDNKRAFSLIRLNGASTGHVMGYAAGEINDNNRFDPNTVVDNRASKIFFEKNVDLMSKNGFAFLATNGGEIQAGTTTAKTDVRAAGSQSVIAYANGRSTTGDFASKVTVNGKVVAADWLTLNDTVYNSMTDANKARAYENIGAYADNGGQIEIDGDTAATTFKEGGADTNTDNSLIFGIGAIAKGGSTVKMENVTIIDNEYGGLYAENNGLISFKGNIVNQNNNSTTGTISSDSKATVHTASENRNAKSRSTVNTHTNVSPFYVNRFNASDQSSITFTGDTALDMYDGILLTGNRYGNLRQTGDSIGREWDYAADAARPTDVTEANIWDNAKYRGMSSVTANILSDNVTIGVINQASDEINWTSDKAGGSGTGVVTGTENFLSGIGAYAGKMKIENQDNHLVDVTSINNRMKIDEDINIEDIEKTKATANPATDKNDTFNDLKMESTYLTINNGKTVSGDAHERDLKDAKGNTNYQVRNVGLAMANSLNRWDDVKNANNTIWRKTRKGESGFTNLGTVDIWGGSKDVSVTSSPVTGLLVNFGTIINGDGTNVATVRVDHGNAIVGTDGSVLKNLKDSEVIVTGKYVKPASNAPTQGNNANRSDDSAVSGNNYGILGISDTNEITYNYADENALTGVDNSVEITHEDGKIYVEGDQAVGIYAENRNDGAASGVKINYVNSAVGSTGIDVSNANVTSPNARGIGIALVNSNTNYADGSANAGGIINLTGGDGTLATWGTAATALTPGSLGLTLGGNDIYTGKNGIGIYAESAEINLLTDNFTVETADNGVGLWAMDDSRVGIGANHQKTFQYNYNGANDKNGFAMVFGGRNIQTTNARNDLDIKFTNKADTAVTLANELAGSTTGTTKGIAGILVNTNDHADTVTNYGHIEEDGSSVTNVRAYGAIVNKGTFINYGDIKLNDSLNEQANTITSEDMKKANIGIFANSANTLTNSGGTLTTIENHGDITIGDSTNDKNIGSWAIYGYNVNTGAKADGSKSQITVNKNNYGIYSGDGNVNIQQTKILVGNDTVMGHVQTTTGAAAATNPSGYPINRQVQYANPNNLLSALDTPRERDSVIGVYIDSNQTRTNTARNINVSADMDIDRFSYGIVLAEKNGGAATNVTIGSATDTPVIRLAYSTNNNAGGHVKSTAPTNPKVPEEVKEQGNAVYYYSLDTESRATSYANITMDGDYNTAYYTKGSVDNYGTIDLRSKYDLDNKNVDLGYGNVGIFSSNTNYASTNYGTITTGMSDTVNMEYSAAMAAGRNIYKANGTYDRTQEQGYIVNRGTINVQEKEGIGMFATGAGSKAVNWGTINLVGESSIGMYLDRGATGENYGTITGNAQNLKGVVAINGGYIKNYGTINVLGTGSYGIVTDGSKFIVNANGDVTEVLPSTDPRYSTAAAVSAGQTNGQGGTDLYGGTESSIEEGTAGNPKTTGVGTTITAPDIVPIAKISVDGVDTPVFNVESDAALPGQWARNISVSSSIQSGGTRIIDLHELDTLGENARWPNAYEQRPQLSQVTSIGMYVDTSGIRYTNPIDGIENLPNLGKVDLYFGPEATLYTNSKAIRIGDRVDENGVITKSNILKPFNDALNKLSGGARINPLSASLTWQVVAKLDDNNQLTEVYMSKVPYHSFAYDHDTSLVNFTNNLDNIYEIAKPLSKEKVIFNKLNSLGNGEGHILAQAFDQMRGHIYGGVQQRTKATADILSSEFDMLRSETNASKDSNKFKAFGQRNEHKTDTAGIPDWRSTAGGFAFVHEDETVKLGERSGWYAGAVNNYFVFKDLSRSYENQGMVKAGVFKQTPLDENGTFTWVLAGEGFFGRTDTKRKFWVVDEEFNAKSGYFTYGGAIKTGVEKVFRINQGLSIVPNAGIDFEYGRYSTIRETGDMALTVKSDDYLSVKPNAGVDFRYSQPVFKNSNFVASLGFGYEAEIGKVNNIENKARIDGAWTDYYTIKGDKEGKKGNFKSDLKLGVENGRFGFNVNAGYDTTGNNFRAGLGIKVMY